MKLTQELINKDFSLVDASRADIDDFFIIERATHKKYIDEHVSFFGGWNETILADAFKAKLELTFFKKLLLHGDTVGFLNYNVKPDKINDVSIRVIDKAQNQGIGTWFLSNLIALSDEAQKPLFIEAIKTNPAQKLYIRMGLEIYEEKDVFYFFTHNPVKL